MDERTRTALVDDFTEIVRQGQQIERGERHDWGRNPRLAHNALWQLCRLIRERGLVSLFTQNQILETGLADGETRQYIVVGLFGEWRLGFDVWGRFYLISRHWQAPKNLILVCDPTDDQLVSPVLEKWSEAQMWQLFKAFVDGLTPIRDQILSREGVDSD